MLPVADVIRRIILTVSRCGDAAGMLFSAWARRDSAIGPHHLAVDTSMLTPDGTYWLALGVLFALAGIVVAMTAACWRRTNYTPFQYIFYLYAFFTARIIWRAQVPQGEPRLPRRHFGRLRPGPSETD